MKLGIMQPYLFPYMGYYQLVNAVDKFVFLDDVNFINKGWINRNNILINGKANLFTVPLQNASQNKLINEISLAEGNWREKLLRTIEMTYKKAPQFSTVFPLVSNVLTLKECLIGNLAKESIKSISVYLQFNTEFVDSSATYNNKGLKGGERIINICEKENATDYINPIGGLELYNKGTFAERNINLHFIRTSEIVYQQANTEFVPWLSIIDVLMFNSKARVKELMTEYVVE
jgi:hypothetical protein